VSARRELLTRTTAAAIAAATCVEVAQAAEPTSTAAKARVKANRAAHSAALRIQSEIRRHDTILRLAGGSFGYPTIWEADNRKLVSWLLSGPTQI
jgi:hypothetical protein